MKLKEYLKEETYGKDAKKDLDIVLKLRREIHDEKNKIELVKLMDKAKKISKAWGYKMGHGGSDTFLMWLENKIKLSKKT